MPVDLDSDQIQALPQFGEFNELATSYGLTPVQIAALVKAILAAIETILPLIFPSMTVAPPEE